MIEIENLKQGYFTNSSKTELINKYGYQNNKIVGGLMMIYEPNPEIGEIDNIEAILSHLY